MQSPGSTIPDARQLLQQVQGQLQASWPQLQQFMDLPGAVEMRAELLANLSRRFFARTIKMIFGPQVCAPSCGNFFSAGNTALRMKTAEYTVRIVHIHCDGLTYVFGLLSLSTTPNLV